MDEKIAELAGRLREAGRVVAFTGAGMSAESGIPTFRGTGGLWEKYPPMIYGNLPGLFLASILQPGKFKGFLREAVQTFTSARPNPGHEALAALEELLPRLTVVTQNVDNLHPAAGSTEVYEVHGSIYRFRCTKCGARRVLDKEELEETAERFLGAGWVLPKLIFGFGSRLPICADCGGLERPDVVFFGEGLPEKEWESSVEACEKSDVFMAIGTSVMVYPAAHLPELARRHGAFIVDINPEPTLTRAKLQIRGTASEVLPRVVEAMGRARA